MTRQEISNALESKRNSLEYLIFQMWCRTLDYSRAREIPAEAIQSLIADTRALMTDECFPPTYQHDFFVVLRDRLKAYSLGHPTTKRLIDLLDIELEFN
jgi:hypothetical protein